MFDIRRQWTERWQIGLIVWGITLALQGCGSSNNLPANNSAKVVEDDPIVRPMAKKADLPRAPVPPQTDPEGASEDPVKNPSHNQVAQVNAFPPPLPPSADLNTWTEHDFHVARITSDPRILDAVAERIRNPKHTVEEAEQLTVCLKPLKLDKSAPVFASLKPGSHPSTVKASDLIRLVTAALSANGTDTAREILGNILSGELVVEDSQAGIDGALAALLQQNSPKCEQIVLNLLLAPPRIISSEDSKTVDPLQKSLFAALRTNASADLRTRLAKMVFAESVPASQRRSVLPLLLDSNPLNLEAQTIIYQNPAADRATLVALEKQFSLLSSETLRSMVKFSAQTTPLTGVENSSPGEANIVLAITTSLSPPPLDQASRVSQLLWNPAFVNFVDLQHHGLMKMADRPSAMALAATIPTDQMRRNLRQTLNRHWSEGPQSLRSAEIGGRLLAEPGFLLVVKSAAWANTSKKSFQPLKFKTSANASAPKENSALLSPINSEWIKFREELTRDYCHRCQAAAAAQAVEDRQTQSVSPPKIDVADAPLSPLPGSSVDAALRFNWTGQRDALSPQSDGGCLRFYYLRFGLRTTLSRILTYYRREMSSCWEHRLADAIWLESLSEAAAADHAQTVDVLISLAKSDAAAGMAEEQAFSIDVLVIDISSPPPKD